MRANSELFKSPPAVANFPFLDFFIKNNHRVVDEFSFVEGETDINSVDSFEHTALWHAVRRNNIGRVRWLLSKGANFGRDYHDRYVYEATLNGELGMVKTLVAAGCSVNEGSFDKPPAIFVARYDILEYLLSLPNIDINSKRYQEGDDDDTNAKTALQTFIVSPQNKSREIILLIEKGIKLDTLDWTSKTPLLYFCAFTEATLSEQDYDRCIEAFIKHGADFEAVDQNEDNVFLSASSNPVLLKVLLKYAKKLIPSKVPAMLNHQHVTRWSSVGEPLLSQLAHELLNHRMRAQIHATASTEDEYIETIKLLIKNGANPSLRGVARDSAIEPPRRTLHPTNNQHPNQTINVRRSNDFQTKQVIVYML